ncbi:hypothetical protein PSTG_06792 [Puccinia striiformis f. sp. tritici PST-78]|uniref:Uncharacterized protein n=1 Tax=Puccinia striiformis f. sp. tritici PST-78 TaxID=1165861 RepID=A0A0L0VKZ3_9BASI|nr:hypothetical protein PSTG_06792 [Puccinia striiformis f. sp. tritici PST-78]
MTTVIQLACSQHKNKTVETSTSYAPMELDTIQAFRHQQGKYVILTSRTHPLSPTQHQFLTADHNCHLRKLCSIVSVPFFLHHPRENPKAQIRTGQPAPVPPPPQNQLRQLDSPKASDGKFLLDSGVSTYVSGNLKYSTTRQTLAQPKTITLAVADCTVDVSSQGTINGTIKVKDVYYFPGVDGVILLVGRLTSDGWMLNISGEEAILSSPVGLNFQLAFTVFVGI